MSPPDEAIWPIEPHTVAKHRILREYLEAWFPIFAQSKVRQFTYAEGFAGPGVYTGGEPGSPVIALEVFLARRHLLKHDAHLQVLFIEQDRRRVDHLRHQTQRKIDQYGGLPLSIRMEISESDASRTLTPALQEASPKKEPFLAILDGWGGPDPIPFTLARSVADRPGGEVLITFEPQHLVRFGKLHRPSASGDRCFGSEKWKKVFDLPPPEKKGFLVTTYRSSLQEAGFRYVCSFEMLDEGSHELHLVFATNHIKGLEKMKDAMWKVDRRSGYRFRDPRDPNQMELVLEEQPVLEPLRHVILEHLAQGAASVNSLRELALSETVYRYQDASAVLRELYKKSRIASSTGRSPTRDDTVWLNNDPQQRPEPQPQQPSLF